MDWTQRVKDESVFCGSNSPRRDLDWRGEQQRLFVVGVPKALAIDAGVGVDVIYRYKRGHLPVPAHRAFAISAAQNDFRYLQLLAERVSMLLMPRRALPVTRPTMLLLADLVLSFGEFMRIAEKLQRGEPLTDDEMRTLEEQGEQVKARVDALIEQARRQRQGTGNGERGAAR